MEKEIRSAIFTVAALVGTGVGLAGCAPEQSSNQVECIQQDATKPVRELGEIAIENSDGKEESVCVVDNDGNVTYVPHGHPYYPYYRGFYSGSGTEQRLQSGAPVRLVDTKTGDIRPATVSSTGSVEVDPAAPTTGKVASTTKFEAGKAKVSAGVTAKPKASVSGSKTITGKGTSAGKIGSVGKGGGS